MEKKTFWDKFAFAYDTFESFNKRAYQAMLFNIASLVPENAEVLECAAGTGAITAAVAPKARSVLCTDLSPQMLEQARRKAEKAGFLNISFAVRNLYSLPEGDGSFDAVIAANVLHLLDKPYDALEELWRVTKRGGILIIPTFLTSSGENRLKLLIGSYKLLGFKPAHSFSEAQYRTMLGESGLPQPDIKVLHGKVPVGFAVFRKE